MKLKWWIYIAVVVLGCISTALISKSILETPHNYDQMINTLSLREGTLIHVKSDTDLLAWSDDVNYFELDEQSGEKTPVISEFNTENNRFELHTTLVKGNTYLVQGISGKGTRANFQFKGAVVTRWQEESVTSYVILATVMALIVFGVIGSMIVLLF